MIVKAGRFSILPIAFEDRAHVNKMLPYKIACKEILAESLESSVVCIKWFHDNPRFNSQHSAMEQVLNENLIRRSANGGYLPKTNSLDQLDFLWTRENLLGLFRCGVMVVFDSIPTHLAQLFQNTTGPFVVQGANETYRSAITKSKKISALGDQFVLMFRGDEIEIYAKDEQLAELFIFAYENCIQ
jgi:hypothetical protein